MNKLPFVSIARVLKTRGIRGEVAAELLTDFPERFSSVSEVCVVVEGKHYWEEIESYWFHKNRVILKFRGRNTPESVQNLIGGELQIPERERHPLPEGSYYHSDLVGCEVFEGDSRLGTVKEVFGLGQGSWNLVVATESGKELMVPLARDFISSVDVEAGIIRVQIPEALKELATSSSKRRNTLSRK
ncbi:MAG: 16S rRNA processing protein RimM [Acidobacteria bacterium]|nr:16S rRNA processing protein RimM [Acidobacteriota bacterium]